MGEDFEICRYDDGRSHSQASRWVCPAKSRYTEHSVKNSPWKDGKGDVVREFADAVLRAEGMAVGIYLSPADLFQIENAAGYYGNGKLPM